MDSDGLGLPPLTEQLIPRCLVAKTCVPFPNHLHSNKEPSGVRNTWGRGAVHYFTAVSPIHNRNNHWDNLIIQNNSVGPQHSFIDRYTPKMFYSLVMLVVKLTHIPSQQSHPISPTQNMGGGDRKGFLQLIITASQRQKDKNVNKIAFYCGVFPQHQRWLNFKNRGKAVSCL